MGQAGASPLNLKTAGARATLKFLYDALHTYKIMPPDTVTADYTALQTSFENGHIAMWPTWDGILGSLLPNAKGGNTKFPTYGKVNIAVPPKGAAKNSTITASWGWSISKFSPNKDMAAKFIQYASSPQNEVLLAQTASTPARVALYSNPEVQAVIPQAKYDALYAKEVPVGSRPITAQAQRVSDALETVINEYLNKQLSLDAAITQGQQRIDQILNNS
jgi:ABC-type glycerol-3-phosphate transport system substrate-binding protein